MVLYPELLTNRHTELIVLPCSVCWSTLAKTWLAWRMRRSMDMIGSPHVVVDFYLCADFTLEYDSRMGLET